MPHDTSPIAEAIRTAPPFPYVSWKGPTRDVAVSSAVKFYPAMFTDVVTSTAISGQMTHPRFTQVTNLSNSNYTLKHPVEVSIEPEDGGFLLSNDRLHVHVFGESVEEALTEWQDRLIGLYHCYADTSDGQLTKSARELKQRLMAAIEGR